MPVTINGTTGVVFPDGVTQGSGVPTASATSGAPLVSNGTIYTQNTAVAVAFGGTGATDAGTARSNLGTNDAANITTGTLSSSRLPSSGINAASITTGTLAVANGGTGGLLPVANGGTGTSSPSLVGGTNITISGSWPNQTVTAAGGGVTSLNGQTGAITNTNYDSIGSYGVLLRAINTQASSRVTIGSTSAGSSLRYNWTASANGGDTASYNYQPNAGGYAGGGSALSGTWRAMGRDHVYNEEGNGFWYAGLWVRIS